MAELRWKQLHEAGSYSGYDKGSKERFVTLWKGKCTHENIHPPTQERHACY